jgi:hypothetical protein
MNMFTFRIHTILLCVVMALSTLIAACNGGTSIAGGVGSGGTGVAEGAVSGFGSVIVAGVEYDDTDANVVVENAQGQTEVTEAKLGQRVRIKHSKTGVADTIQVLPQLRGTASGAQDAQGVFQLLGQTVQIVSTSDTQNTATVLDGLTAVASGDELEVHGNWIFDNARNYSVLIATRIEKLSTAADPVMVSGIVRSRQNDVLTLDDATAQTLHYANMPSDLSAQSLMTAWIPRSALSTAPWAATRLVDASPSISDNEHLTLNTQISERDLANGEIRVQGMRVKLSGTPPNIGSTVQIDIIREGNTFKAVTLEQRRNDNELGGAVELKGSVQWPATPTQINLRGNLVNVPNAALASNCTGLNTNDKVYLEIKAQRVGPGLPLRATSVSCSAQIPDSSVIEVSGTLTQLSNADKTMQISTSNGTLNLVWNNTSLLPRDLNSLLNHRVEVEYQTVNGENRLRKVKPD